MILTALAYRDRQRANHLPSAALKLPVEPDDGERASDDTFEKELDRGHSGPPENASGDGPSQAKFEEASRQIQLEEGQIGVQRQHFDLQRQKILLGMTLVLAIATVVCAAVSVHWPVPTATGGGGITAWVASVVEGRKANKPKGSRCSSPLI